MIFGVALVTTEWVENNPAGEKLISRRITAIATRASVALVVHDRIVRRFVQSVSSSMRVRHGRLVTEAKAPIVDEGWRGALPGVESVIGAVIRV